MPFFNYTEGDIRIAARPGRATFVSGMLVMDGMNAPMLSTPPATPGTGDFYFDDGTNTSSGNPGILRWSGSAWVEVGNGAGGYDTEFAVAGISLSDGEDFTITESTLRTTVGIGTTLTLAPSVFAGQVTIELYRDLARTQKVFELVTDLSDSTTLTSSRTFGFDTTVDGTLYGTLSCSGVAGGATGSISLRVYAALPVLAPPALDGSLGAGLENDGLGHPRIALASASGLSLGSDVLAVAGDAAQPVHVAVNTSGAYVVGAVNTTTAQSVAGEKLFDSAGLTPRGTVGAPTTGTWSQGVEVLDSALVRWRCVTAGTPGTWELADTVTAETEVVVSGAVLPEGGTALLEIPVYGDAGTARCLRIWARHASGTATDVSVHFSARIYENTAREGRGLVWRGAGLARQTHLTALLPASQSYLEVSDNNLLDTDELVCVYESDLRYEFGRCSARTGGHIWLSEALVDAGSWAIGTLVPVVTEFTMVPWLNTDGSPANRRKILIEVLNDGLVTDPSLIFYVQASAMSLGVVR